MTLGKAETFTFDANGNLADTTEGQHFQYDAQDRTTSATGINGVTLAPDRYAQDAENDTGFVHLGCILILLRQGL